MAKNFGKWNKRWYVLKKNKLHNFKEKGHKTEKGNILMKTVSSVTRITNIKKLSIPDKFKDMVFELRAQSKTFFFVASDPHSMEKWVGYLELSRQMFAASGVYYLTNTKDRQNTAQRAPRFSFSMGDATGKGRGKIMDDSDEDDEVVIVSAPNSGGVNISRAAASGGAQKTEQQQSADKTVSTDPTEAQVRDGSPTKVERTIVHRKIEVVEDPDPEPLSLAVWQQYYNSLNPGQNNTASDGQPEEQQHKEVAVEVAVEEKPQIKEEQTQDVPAAVVEESARPKEELPQSVNEAEKTENEEDKKEEQGEGEEEMEDPMELLRRMTRQPEEHSQPEETQEEQEQEQQGNKQQQEEIQQTEKQEEQEQEERTTKQQEEIQQVEEREEQETKGQQREVEPERQSLSRRESVEEEVVVPAHNKLSEQLIKSSSVDYIEHKDSTRTISEALPASLRRELGLDMTEDSEMEQEEQQHSGRNREEIMKEIERRGSDNGGRTNSARSEKEKRKTLDIVEELGKKVEKEGGNKSETNNDDVYETELETSSEREVQTLESERKPKEEIVESVVKESSHRKDKEKRRTQEYKEELPLSSRPKLTNSQREIDEKIINNDGVATKPPRMGSVEKLPSAENMSGKKPEVEVQQNSVKFREVEGEKEGERKKEDEDKKKKATKNKRAKLTRVESKTTVAMRFEKFMTDVQQDKDKEKEHDRVRIKKKTKKKIVDEDKDDKKEAENKDDKKEGEKEKEKKKRKKKDKGEHEGGEKETKKKKKKDKSKDKEEHGGEKEEKKKKKKHKDKEKDKDKDKEKEKGEAKDRDRSEMRRKRRSLTIKEHKEPKEMDKT
eukprot:TRINITY_DN664_c0_g3_i3.p1 TRINITY_DN664_c0_g3~~TRINITY_DN664_c0_g3_i3.p1  ORF type:complete len:877 (-),score=360.30 TRINITY_DN664_c0_g3_i3:68-2572(-)